MAMAIAPSPMFYPRFVILGKRFHTNGNTEAKSWTARYYQHACQIADSKAALGFGCVVIDTDQRSQVYERNIYMLQANVASMNLPPMDQTQYDKFERRSMEQDMIKAANIPYGNYLEWKPKYIEACETTAIWPRESGQQPIDSLQDWAWLEESLKNR